MKGKLVSKLLENRRVVRTGCALMAAVVLLSGGLYIYDSQNAGWDVPVIIEEGEVVIGDEDVPLATAPTVQKKKPTTKTTTKKVNLKKANTKTYTKKLATKTKTQTKTQNLSDRTVKTVTKTTTTTTEQYKKKQKYKTVITKVKTEVTITTTMKAKAPASTKAQTTTTASAAKTGSSASESVVKKTLPISTTLPKADANVRDAFEKMGFTIQVDSTVTYMGKFDVKTRSITMRKEDHESVYHELGHFLMWMYNTGSANDGGEEGRTAYEEEKGLYTGFNSDYVNQDASEYMAESYRDYCTNPTALQNERPKTYALIQKAVEGVTDKRVSTYMRVYSSLWK